MSKNKFIDSVRVGSPCTEDWDKMVGNERVRLCLHCVKEVNNLSEMTRKDAKRLVRSSDGNICIRYMQHPVTKRPIFADQLHQITRRAPGIAAGVMTASMSLATMAYAQGGSSFGATNSERSRTGVTVEIKAEKPIVQTRETDRNTGKTDKDAASSAAGISGTVTDPQGAVIAGAGIVLSNELTKAEVQIGTNEDGRYDVSNILPGIYDLVVSYPGFKKTIVSKVEIAAGELETQDIKLEIGEIVSLGGVIAVARDYSTALARAVDNDDIKEVRSLIVNGANVNGKDQNYDNLTPLFIAVENGNLEIVQILFDAGAKINVRDKNKRTALMQLDTDATPELIGMLIRQGVKLNLSDNEGNTALIYAAGGVSTEVLRALIEAGADVNLANKEGETPLMKAAENGHLENVRLLLESGANVHARDNEGDNAWDYADDENIEKLLENYGIELPADEEKTPGDDPKVVISR